MFSGGLDSACAFYVMGKPDCICCGGKEGPARDVGIGEIGALREMCKIDPDFVTRLTYKDFDWRPFMRAGQHTLPRENILSIVAWAAGYDVAMFGWTRNDCDGKRIKQMQESTTKAVSMSGFKTSFPVWPHYRHQLIQMALDTGAPPKFLRAAWSCLSRGDVHCGECTNCIERFIAMRHVGIPDCEYAVNPVSTKMYQTILNKFAGDKTWAEQFETVKG